MFEVKKNYKKSCTNSSCCKDMWVRGILSVTMNSFITFLKRKKYFSHPSVEIQISMLSDSTTDLIEINKQI